MTVTESGTDRRRRRLLAAMAVLALAACERTPTSPKFLASEITEVAWGRNFELVDVSGTPRTLADYRGKIVMLFFGYTHCPDVCPITLAKMADAVNRLGDAGSRVQGLFVTLDPDRDTAEVLTRYAPAFHPSFSGLSADPATIDALAADFKVFVKRQAPDENGAYPVDHSGGIFIFDTVTGRRLYVRADAPTDALVADLRLLL